MWAHNIQDLSAGFATSSAIWRVLTIYPIQSIHPSIILTFTQQSAHGKALDRFQSITDSPFTLILTYKFRVSTPLKNTCFWIGPQTDTGRANLVWLQIEHLYCEASGLITKTHVALIVFALNMAHKQHTWTNKDLLCCADLCMCIRYASTSIWAREAENVGQKYFSHLLTS